MSIILSLDVERDWFGGEYYASEPVFDITRRALRGILSLASELGIPLTLFFTGEAASALSDLDVDGHDIGVHTHPFTHLFPRGKWDPSIDYLAKYGLREQKAFISMDKSLVEEAFGIKARMFRAGRLSANEVTLKALSALGFRYDSSTYKGPNLCGWRPYFVHDQRVVEVPVFCFLGIRVKPLIIRSLIALVSIFAQRDAYAVIVIHPQEFARKGALKVLYDALSISPSSFCRMRDVRRASRARGPYDILSRLTSLNALKALRALYRKDITLQMDQTTTRK